MKNLVFISYLVTLFWLPLPEGSKPVWAMMILAMLLFSLGAITSVSFVRGHLSATPALRAAWPLHFGFILVACWLWFQQMPLPVEWVELLSPKSAALFREGRAAAGSADYITLSIDPQSTLYHALLTTAYYLLFCLSLILVDTRERLEKLLLIMVVAGTFQATFGALSTLSGLEWLMFREKTAYLGVATGTFVNRNSFAGFLEMTLAAGMGLLLSRLQNQNYGSWRERVLALLEVLLSNKILLRSALAIMVVGLVVSRSRMGNTAFFSSLMVAGLVYVICQRKVTRGMVLLFTSLLVIDMAIVSQWFGLEQVIDRIENTSMIKETRPNVSLVTLTMVKDYALTGAGAGAYYTALPEYHDGSWRGYYDLAHNDYLQFPAEFGVPAFIFLSLMVVMALYQAVQAMRIRRKKLHIGAGFAAFMGILAILIHATVDFNFQIPANAAYFVVLMAIAFIARHMRHGKARHRMQAGHD